MSENISSPTNYSHAQTETQQKTLKLYKTIFVQHNFKSKRHLTAT